MRNLRNLCWFLAGVVIAAVVIVPSAYAQAPANASVDPGMQRALNAIMRNTPGVITNNVSNGVSTMGTGTANVTTASGLNIPMPTSATANVSNAAIAKAGAKLVKAGSLIGLGDAFVDLYNAMKQQGFIACPAPNFVCRPQPADFAGDPPGTGYCAYGVSATRTCDLPLRIGQSAQAVATERMNIEFAPYTQWNYTVSLTQSGGQINALVTLVAKNNPALVQTSPFTIGRKANFYVPPLAPYADAELEQAFKDKLAADPSFAKRYYDAIRADNARNNLLDETYALPKDTPLNFPPDTSIVLPPDTPLDIYSPSVTTPEKTVKTRTIPLADGTVNTETTKETTTVTPTKTGTTVGDTKITYPTTTTQTVTTTNNTTNNTTTTTTVINESPQSAQPPQEPVDPCKGNPNRAGCALLGEPPAPEAIPSQDVPISVTPVPFASAAGCPSSIAFEAFGARSMSYQPLCDKMTEFRPLFLALASLTAAMVFMGGLKL